MKTELKACGLLLAGALGVVGTAWAQGSEPAKAPAPASSGSARPPAYMYEEPLPPDQRMPAPGASAKSAAEPQPPSPPPPPPAYAPYYVYEPLPPPPLRHRAPANSFWLGARGGVLFPNGALYSNVVGRTYDGADVVDPVYFSDLAGPGPSFELNVGGRFARRYIVYLLWEHAFLGSGADTARMAALGDQESASTDLAGVGFRWSSNPDEVGVVLDLGLGHRWFRASWANGTRLDMRGFGEIRIGIGADIRVMNRLALSPLFSFSLGEFTEQRFRDPTGSLGPGDYTESHGTIGLTLGAHYDLAP